MTLILAVSKDKVYGGQIFETSAKGSDFGTFLINLLKNNNELLENLETVYFYMDNAKIHQSKILNQLLSKLNIFYGPPYSPFIDMIEECFA